MATVKYPIWLSVCYSMGPVLLPVYRTWRWISGHKERQEFRVLLFHDIPENRMGRFARLVRYLKSRNALIDRQKVEDLLKGRAVLDADDRTQYLLTFDDGFESQAHATREVLDPLGIKALFFVCPQLMNVTRDRQRQKIAAQMFEGALRSERLPEDMSLMSWDDLNELVALGHTIGSHTGTHRRLSTLPSSAVEAEIVDSADLIEAHTDKSVRWFAYPFGDIDSIDVSSLGSISRRYAYCCTGVAGPNNAQTEPLGILRQNIDLDLTFAYQLFVLEGGMDFLYRSSADKYRSMISSIPQAETAQQVSSIVKG